MKISEGSDQEFLIEKLEGLVHRLEEEIGISMVTDFTAHEKGTCETRAYKRQIEALQAHLDSWQRDLVQANEILRQLQE